MRNLFLITLFGFVSCNDSAKTEKSPEKDKEKTALELKLHDLNDQPIDLKQYKGKTVFINFWATWCKPCLLEMPSIKTAQDVLSKEGVIFLLASNEMYDQITEFKKDNNYDFNYLRITNLEELNVNALPTTYIFNPKRELVFSESGYRKWDDPSNIEMIKKINNQK